jgi:hypothetical protein
VPNPSFIAGFFLAFAPFGRRMPPASVQPTPAQARVQSPSESQARELQRQYDEIEGRLEEQRQRLIIETVGLAGAAADLETYGAGSPEAAAATDAANRPWKEHAVTAAPLEVKAALLAEELQRYKETGVLSPTPPATAARLELLLEHPWSLPPSTPEVAGLSLDLTSLQKQLGVKDRVDRRPAVAKPASIPRREALPALEAPRPSAPSMTSARPMFERDAGTGKAETDPVPDLIVQLSSSNPRGRALAADQLGSLGAAAAPAAAALKGALRDSDRRVRASAALALGAAGNADAAVELRRVLRDPDEEVRLNARGALQKLGFDSKYP